MIDVLQDYRIFKMNGEKKTRQERTSQEEGLAPACSIQATAGACPSS